MIEWLKTLELEYVIIFTLLTISVILLLFILTKSQRTINLIGKRALILMENLVLREGKHVIDIVVSNSSYVNVEAAAMGLIYKEKLLPLKEDTTIVLARDSYKVTLPIDVLRTKVLGSDKKLKMIDIYVEDSLGRRTKQHAYNAYQALKNILKDEKKAYKKHAKEERYATGDYRFFERVGLLFAWLFSPFNKLSKSVARRLNRRLKEREIRQELKRKEREHQDILREVALEEKHDQARAQLEKRIKEEQKNANIEARKQALKRKEEARKLEDELKKSEEELKKSEEELKIAEEETALHEENFELIDDDNVDLSMNDPYESNHNTEEIMEENDQNKHDDGIVYDDRLEDTPERIDDIEIKKTTKKKSYKKKKPDDTLVASDLKTDENDDKKDEEAQ